MKTFDDWWNASGMDSTTETFGKLTEDLYADRTSGDASGRVCQIHSGI